MTIIVIFSSHVQSEVFATQTNAIMSAGKLSQTQTDQIKLNKKNKKEKPMSAEGLFEVNLLPQNDENPAGRMLIDKTYSGDLVGTGIGQMISKRTTEGSAVYYAIEEFSGQLNGKTGSFTLIHRGAMDKESQSLEVLILAGSGAGELSNISGTLQINQDNGTHSYLLDYELQNQ